jgi:membrane-bound lytic murein transglycosylase D
VVSVADRFGVSAGQLRTWNHLKGNALTAGRKLQVASPSFSRAARRSTHKHGRGKAPMRSTHAAAGHAAAGSASGSKSSAGKKSNRTGGGKASKPAKKKKR